MSARAGRGRIVVGTALLGALAAVAILSPILATDLPLVQAVGGRTEYPAFRAWLPALLGKAAGQALAEGTDRRPAIVPFGPDRIELRERLEPPSRRHWLGTDELGRDLLARMLHGARISLLVGFAAAAFALLIGVLLGGVAGYFGGWLDLVISRAVEIVIAFPFLVLLLALVAILSPGIATIIMALAVTSWPVEARLVRGEVLRLRELEFSVAARASGAGAGRVLLRHLLPNAIQPALVSASFGIAAAIMVESAISFLGFGIPLPHASWGTILSSADDHLRRAWWLALFPGIAIFLTVIASNLVGEGLRERLEKRG
ncbi:MAG TPA: ABC transporter permease [Thermoanaerobaculia bacterium]|nr:ABC transporter permease [Thermoanaerobaculia bacterium]